MLRSHVLAVGCVIVTTAAVAHADPDYLTDVKPVLAARCYACHGALQQKADLRVDTAKELVDSGVIVPAKSAASDLVRHIVSEVGYDRMPPESEGGPLTVAQVAAIRAWIDAGAAVPTDERADPDPRDHWAFRAPVRPTVPGDGQPIDAFLAAKWAEHGLTPNPPADRRLLLRRITFDLTGLPPTPEETAAFLADESPDAYEKLVDRLFASPQYGERWGRHFMDIWRYSDGWGLGKQVRNSQKHLWHWRDWIVESVNTDVGYDEMVRQMLAADELDPTDPDKLRATGFLARQYYLFNRTTWMDGLIEHGGKAFLGLTFNCAKCHDHKFDPISQTDYYRLRAFFEPYQVRTDMVPGEVNFEKDGIPRAYDCDLEAVTHKHRRGDDRQPIEGVTIEPGVPGLLSFGELTITEVKLTAESHTPGLRPFVRENHLAASKADGGLATATIRARAEADRLKASGSPEAFQTAARKAAGAEATLALHQAETALDKAEAALAKAADAKATAAATKTRDAARKAVDAAKKKVADPGVDYSPLRGAVKSQSAPTEAITAAQAATFPKTSTGRRTALANWIADRRNPLTARVLVNHVWARQFGTPLVATVFDFGRKGATPTHPELLDWLAVEFTDHDWSMKHLHRLIVTSDAYRMSSSNSGAKENLKADGDNRYLWRQNPKRLEAEAVRDGLLHLAGTLDLTRGGPSIPLSQQDTSPRRSLYFVHSHNDHHKFLSQFDGANVLDCYRRDVSIVPQQALALANSKFALTMADAIFDRVMDKFCRATDEAFITAAFEMILGTTPTAGEIAACQSALADWGKVIDPKAFPDPREKARRNLIAALLNHNDFVTVR